ncbi:FAD:protein FMN transferase [uncultured Proteiniphilum sp.]|uniref:FAD:protein FMN transferase n=1 Tax=uncultured Proteiniphilum sp. TaxID=497637 RepID=UPI0026138568|nr:FAD:protein FMN transferase [uncultured Proteiniphilum sp.]
MFHGSLKNIMGTRFDILIIDQNRLKSQEIWNDIVFELRRLDQIFNRFDSTSETSKINCEAITDPVHVSPEMWFILRSCQIYYTRTLGLFDITLNDFSKVLLDEKAHTVIFSKKDISLDFGGYAKGYALLKIKDLIYQAGVQHCFVDFGNSSILGIGHHPHGDSWKVSIENPYDQNEILDEISLKDQALSVSGNTPSYTGHIVRPTSVESVKAHKVVSITSDDPLDAEVLSTVFMMTNDMEKKRITENFKVQNIAEYSL